MTEIRLPQLGQAFPGLERVGTQLMADSTKAQAWKREMERSQLAAWFLPVQIGQTEKSPTPDSGREFSLATPFVPVPAQDAPIPPNESSNLSGPTRDALPEGSRLDAVNPSATPTAARTPQAGERGVAGQPDIASASVRPGGGFVTVNDVVREVLAALEATTVDLVNIEFSNVPLAIAIDGVAKTSQESKAIPSTALTKGSAPTPDQREIRVHAQWSASGVQVWLGIDGRQMAQGQPLAMIVAELKRVLLQHGRCLGAVICNGKMVYQLEQVQGDSVWHETESQVESQEALQTLVFGRGLPPRVWSQTAYSTYQAQEQ